MEAPVSLGDVPQFVGSTTGSNCHESQSTDWQGSHHELAMQIADKTTVDYEYGKPLADTHSLALLDEHLYFSDGQIKDEVYVYGSFIQSRMYKAGVTCSNYHSRTQWP